MKNLNFFLGFFLLFFAINSHAQLPVYFEPSSLEATVNAGDSEVVHTILRNASAETIEFSFPGFASRGQGGPDSFGYSWIDSDEAGGPAYEWNDISETGILVVGLHDDNLVGPFEMDFDFPFYGQTKNQFWINSNGSIGFNNQVIQFANGPIPTNSNYTDFIAWFWDDLTIDTANTRVYFRNFAEKTIAQFNKMVHYPGSASYITAQVVMMGNGAINIRYKLISEDFAVNTATIGLQSSNPQLGLQVVYNEAYLHPEMAIRFNLNRNFITSVSPASLVLAPGTQETIWITYNSTGYETGSYEQDLTCLTSHPQAQELFLHNVMHVINQSQAGFSGYVTDEATGYAINEAKVKVGEHQVFTNANGYYELPLEPGNYNVTFSKNGFQSLIVEDTAAVAGFSTLSVELSGFYFIAGQVFAGDTPIETGFGYGYKMLEGEVVDIYADMIGGEGWFEFSGLSQAQYILKAEPSPNSVYYGDYLPTYFGDVLHWEDASVIDLTQSTDDAHIHLIAAVSSPAGPGIISGTVENGSKSADVAVILQNSGQNSVAITYTAADGTFAFNDLAYGTYEIFAEIPGIAVVPQMIVLDETNPVAEGIKMVILDDEIIFLGIATSEIFRNMPVVYPNPVKEQANVLVNLKKPGQVSISVADLSGKVVLTENYTISDQRQIALNVKSLAAGMYMLRFESRGEVFVQKLIKE